MPIPKQPKPVPHPPPPSPTPSPIPARLKTLQKQISRVQQRIEVSELTASQRRLGKLPAPQAVEQVGGGAALGEARYLKGGLEVLQRIGVYSPSTKVALTYGSARPAGDVSGTVRHEAAHHILRRRGVKSEAHHRLMSQSQVTTPKIDFPLLSTARRAHQAGGPKWAEWLERRQEQTRFRGMRGQ